MGLTCTLPITLPTSKVRVKRVKRTKYTEEVRPVSPRKEKLESDDYLEWQISYVSDSGLVEFGLMLKEFYDHGILTRDLICDVVERLGREDVKTFEEHFKIEKDLECCGGHEEFKLIYERTPILRLLLNDGSFIDVVLRHKQRAVGYQAMVFIYIPISSQNLKPVKSSADSLVGMIAPKNEAVEWRPEKEHVIALLKAFIIASPKHREDIKKIISRRLSIDCREWISQRG